MSIIFAYFFIIYPTYINGCVGDVPDFYWRDYIPGIIPYDALSVDNTRYIGQVVINYSTVPATIYPPTNLAVAEWFGATTHTSLIKILCTPDSSKFYWESVDFSKPYGSQLNNAVKGGSEQGFDLYIGSIYDEGVLKISKVFPMNLAYERRGIHVWEETGKGVVIKKFNLLKYNDTLRGMPIANVENTPSHVLFQDFYWRDYIPGTIPYDALQVDNKRYIGQIYNKGHLPATIYPHTNIAIGEQTGAHVVNNDIKIFCTPDPSRFYWESVDFSKSYDMQMKNAVKGGYQWYYDLYIGKAYHDGELKISKVIPMDQEWKALYIWDKDKKSLKVASFQLLKYNATIVSEDGKLIFAN